MHNERFTPEEKTTIEAAIKLLHGNVLYSPSTTNQIASQEAIKGLNELLKTQEQDSALVAELVRGLQDVIDPIGAMIRDLPEGYKLDGMGAVQASQNTETYRRIATRTLEKCDKPVKRD